MLALVKQAGGARSIGKKQAMWQAKLSPASQEAVRLIGRRRWQRWQQARSSKKEFPGKQEKKISPPLWILWDSGRVVWNPPPNPQRIDFKKFKGPIATIATCMIIFINLWSVVSRLIAFRSAFFVMY